MPAYCPFRTFLSVMRARYRAQTYQPQDAQELPSLSRLFVKLRQRSFQGFFGFLFVGTITKN